MFESKEDNFNYKQIQIKGWKVYIIYLLLLTISRYLINLLNFTSNYVVFPNFHRVPVNLKLRFL